MVRSGVNNIHKMIEIPEYGPPARLFGEIGPRLDACHDAPEFFREGQGGAAFPAGHVNNGG
jgi:hypothetical protein